MNDPRTDPLALELDGLLAKFFEAVWHGADAGAPYDLIANDEAEAIQAYCRRTQSQWQPMESAPHDRLILLSLGRYEGKRIVMMGRWTQWTEYVGGGNYRKRGDPFWEVLGGGRRSDGPDPTPDGWMELPE